MTSRRQLDVFDEDLELDVEMMVFQYRHARDTGQVELCEQLRQGWKEWQGDDSLHETACGEQ